MASQNSANRNFKLIIGMTLVSIGLAALSGGQHDSFCLVPRLLSELERRVVWQLPSLVMDAWQTTRCHSFEPHSFPCSLGIFAPSVCTLVRALSCAA